jgi:ribonuclease P protein component
VENRSLPTILKKQSDFNRLKENGQRFFSGSWLLVSYATNSSDEIRYGWTIPKFVGNAVLRNRFKRWYREYARLHGCQSTETGIDMNFVMRRQTKEFYRKLSHKDFDQAVVKACGFLHKKYGLKSC